MYDFKSLSDFDFELLVRDLLQIKLKLELESFKRGPDDGIDLRYSRDGKNTLIVQCKHYARSKYSNLRSELAKEVPKVRKLRPKRYLVATSLELTPANKSEIVKLFKPYCKGPQDVISCGEINNYLGDKKYAAVLRQHYKLWLTSTDVLDQLLNAGTINETRALIETVRDKARLYVQNPSYYDAIKILDEHNYCIISGTPGIGKTFLAQMVLIKHIKDGYTPIVVRQNINEAWHMLNATTQQIFYFDDFLGATGRESRLDRNEDKSIVEFIRYITKHKHARFVLTTREYILQDARSNYDALCGAELQIAKCLLELETYTREKRAHILLNHLQASDLPGEYYTALLDKPTILAIVDHPHYSPRIIEAMTAAPTLKGIAANDYPKHFLGTLNNPTTIWERIFTHHLTTPSRSLLLALSTFTSSAYFEDLQIAFERLRIQEVKSLGGEISANEFTTALRIVDGTFTHANRYDDSYMISFHNPSVRDFIQVYLSNNPQHTEILCKSLTFYDQVRALVGVRYEDVRRAALSARLLRKSGLVDKAIVRTIESSAATINADRTRSWPRVSFNRFAIEVNIQHALIFLRDLKPTQYRAAETALLEKCIARVTSQSELIPDLSGYVDILHLASKLPHATKQHADLNRAIKEQLARNDRTYTEYADFRSIEAYSRFGQDAIEQLVKRRASAALRKEAVLIFDYSIHILKDTESASELIEFIESLEALFRCKLKHIKDTIQEAIIKIEQYDDMHGDESRDDYRAERQNEAKADEDIFNMFR
jgi:hypothetical protein